jgi:hypothetical protein
LLPSSRAFPTIRRRSSSRWPTRTSCAGGWPTRDDVRVERTAERPAFASGQEMWDWVLYGNPIPGMLVADLTESRRAQVRQVLDGMLRERAGADGRAVLTNAVNIGIGTT